LLIAVPVSMALIFLLLFFAFRSIKYSLLIYTAIPLSAIGGVYLLAIRGMPFSISAGVGFIALFGVAVLNGIVLISEFNRLKQSGINQTIRIVLLGTKTRLRPVLMTAFVASLGFLPMALSSGAGAEVQRPLATVVIGGLLLATFLTLFVLPLLYIFIEKITRYKSPIKLTKSTKKYLLWMLLFFSVSTSYAQTIELKEAVDMALKNNFEIRDKELIASFHQKLKETYLELQAMSITGEYGQLNDSNNDQKIGISQSFSLPTVYAHKKNVLQEYWNASLVAHELTTLEVTKTVTEIFYYIIVLQKKEALLSQTDRLYIDFVAKAQLRFERGASNLMEKTSAEIQREKIQIQLQQVQTEITLAEIQLQLLLNTNIPYHPKATSPLIERNDWMPEAFSSVHPSLKEADQQLKIVEAELKWEKTKRLPSFTIGYANQSFRTISNQRFHAVEIGVGIPLFNKALNAQIEAIKIKRAQAESALAYQEVKLDNTYKAIFEKYQMQQQLLMRYEKVLLERADILFETSQKQFDAGSIDYLEWVLLNNQALEIESSYIDAVHALNQTVISLKYITINRNNHE